MEMIRDFLFWAMLLNLGVLTLWSFVLMFAGDFAYRLHSRWFSFSRETFSALIYGFLGAAKIIFVMFFFMPWLALVIVTR